MKTKTPKRKATVPKSREDRNMGDSTEVIVSNRKSTRKSLDEEFAKRPCKKKRRVDHICERDGISPLPGIDSSQATSILQLQEYLFNSFQVDFTC